MGIYISSYILYMTHHKHYAWQKIYVSSMHIYYSRIIKMMISVAFSNSFEPRSRCYYTDTVLDNLRVQIHQENFYCNYEPKHLPIQYYYNHNLYHHHHRSIIGYIVKNEMKVDSSFGVLDVMAKNFSNHYQMI